MNNSRDEQEGADRTDDFGPPHAATPPEDSSDHAQHQPYRHAEGTLWVRRAFGRHRIVFSAA